MKRALDSFLATEFWKSTNFWLTVAAIVVPFGWVFLVLRLEPVRARTRYFRRSV